MLQVSDDAFINDHDAVDSADDDDEDDKPSKGTGQKQGRRKIKIEFIADKSRRHITFSKRKAGIMKKAYELSTLTGTQVLLLVVSETGLVYTFTTAKLQPLVTQPEGKNLIQACLNAPHGTLPQQAMPTAPPGSRPPGAAPAPPANIAGGLSIGGSSTLSTSPPKEDDDEEEDTNPQGGRAKAGDKRRRTTSNSGPNTRSGNGPPPSPTGSSSSSITLSSTQQQASPSQSQAPPSPTSQQPQHTSPPHQHAQPQQYQPANNSGAAAYGSHEMYSGHPAHAHVVPQNTYHQYSPANSAPPPGQAGQPMAAHNNHWQQQQNQYRGGR
ncbi:SRF-type transcription factor (DNA-binding and dimerization domain)-domain-containing protein [Flagelloscypha sp. PMI_526]|nr:SRF-type transcription factor (DNA-binding and dimerization domain)-domain-containing protein [Flagelloscypha sp. PMI_526]